MKIGLFMAPQWPPGADLGQAMAELAEQVRVARQNGFASVLIGQHMVTAPLQMFQPMPLLAYLAREADGMLLGPGVLLLSMVNPVMAAEESATLDWMSNGRFVLAAGLGYRAEEFEVMGTRLAERVSRFTEALEVLKRLWTEERVTHHGRHFHLSDVGASVRPRQQPRPPIWIGGDVEAAVRRAARLGDAWIAAPTISISRAADLMAEFRAERERHGLPAGAACPVIRECFVGTSSVHARSVSRGPLLYKYEAYAAWNQTDTAGTSLAARFDDFAANRFLIGDASAVKDEIQRYAEVLHTDHLILRVQWPGLGQTEALGSIDRLGGLIAQLD